MIHTKQYVSKRDILIMALLLVAFVTGTRAQQNPAEQLLGSWRFEDVSSFATMDARSKVKLDSLPQLKAQILGSYSGRQLKFYSNGSCTLTMANGQSFSYGWSLTDAGVLVLTDSAGNIGLETVRVLNKNRLVLVPKVEGEARNVIEEQHFIKQY